MSVFLDLAMQMCEESEEISSTGEVKFLDLVTYFSANNFSQSNTKNIQSFDDAKRDKSMSKHSESKNEKI